MSELETQLYGFLLEKGKSKKLESLLKSLEAEHNLELLLNVLLKIGKKTLLGAELNQTTVPYLKKYFGSLSTAKSTSIIEDILKYCSKEYSIKLPVELIKLLVESVQLGSANRFREIVKSELITLHNQLREINRDKEADDLAICVGNILLVELNLLDNIDRKWILKIWESLIVSESESPVFLLMTYLIYHTTGAREHCKTIEDQLCQVFQPDDDVVQCFHSYFHVPLTLFKIENRMKIFNELLKYYIDKNMLDTFYDHIYKVPELRNNLLNEFSTNLLGSTLSILWERISSMKKRKSGDSGENLLVFKTLSEKLNEFQKTGTFSIENAKEILNLCCKTFTNFQFNKDFKAMSFNISLIKIKKLIPSMSIDNKNLLIAVMPFVVLAGGTDTQIAELMKIYDQIIDTHENNFTEMITNNDCIYGFLNVLISKVSRDTSELRFYGSKTLSKFLDIDWRFMKEFVKNKNETPAFASLRSSFNKAIRTSSKIARTDIVVVYQTCLNLYRNQVEGIKNEEFKPKKGIGLMLDSLSELLKSIVFSAVDMTSEGQVIGGIIVDLVNIFIQFARLGKLVNIPVENVKVITPFLRNLFDDENGLNIVAATEKKFVLNNLVEVILTLGYHSDLDDIFINIQRLVNLFKCLEISNLLLIKLLKAVDKKGQLNLSTELIQHYPVKKLKDNINEVNAICRLLRLSIDNYSKDMIANLEEYVFYIFDNVDMVTVEMLEFGAVYLQFINKTKYFGDLLSMMVTSAVNATLNQFLTKSYENNVIEIQRSAAIIDLIDGIFKMGTHLIKNQMHIVQQILSKLIFNFTVFEHFALECREHQYRRDEIRLLCDNYWRKLSSLCKLLADSKEYTQILPFIISNCLTGEREPNLPTYNLLAGCDKEGIAFLSTNLPTEQKRRFAITFPTFMEKSQVIS